MKLKRDWRVEALTWALVILSFIWVGWPGPVLAVVFIFIGGWGTLHNQALTYKASSSRNRRGF